ncbi:Uncharacterised protein [Yersinia intermedia]|nr:hypothetical protein yinte0001_30230 [Yersinia intermedia ATCC 29909]VDZ58796.1 Uncharacterised protein [Yersinia intermedia]
MQKFVAKVKVKLVVLGGAGFIALLLGASGVHHAQPCDL